MRFFMIAVFLCFVTLSFGQNFGQNFGQQPPSPTNALSRFIPINRILSWFRRPQPQNQFANGPSNEEFNFNNPLARESTDKIIEDAISKRILEEGKEQQVAAGSSSFIQVVDTDKTSKPNFKNTALNSGQSFSKSVSGDRSSFGRSMANTATDTLPLAEALRIVNTSNLSDCVARVICELSCNANAYGNEGRSVFRNLIKLQFDQNVKSDDAKFFRQAASKGRQFVQGKKDCNECFAAYPSCKSSSKDLVAVSSMFKL